MMAGTSRGSEDDREKKYKKPTALPSAQTNETPAF